MVPEGVEVVPYFSECSNNEVHVVGVMVVDTHFVADEALVVELFGNGTDPFCVIDVPFAEWGAPGKAVGAVGLFALVHRQEVDVLVLTADRDAFGCKCVGNEVPVDAEGPGVELHRIDVVDVGPVGGNNRGFEAGKSLQSVGEHGGKGLSCLDKTLQFFELFNADGAFDFSEPEVVADHVAELMVGGVRGVGDDDFSVVPDEAEPFGKGVVVGDDDAAFSGVDVFVVVEAVAANVGNGAGMAVPVSGSGCLGGVGDDLEVVFVGYGHDGIHVGGHAENVGNHDGSGVGGDVGFNGGRVKVVGVGVDVGKDGNGVPVDDGCCCGAHRPWGDNHFVSGFNANGADGCNES